MTTDNHPLTVNISTTEQVNGGTNISLEEEKNSDKN